MGNIFIYNYFFGKFLSYEENRSYYKPEEICIDYLEHRHLIVRNELLLQNLKNIIETIQI